MCMAMSQNGDAKQLKAFEAKTKDLQDEMNRFAPVPPNTLKEYSSWMASFQASHYGEQLEMPGFGYTLMCWFTYLIFLNVSFNLLIILQYSTYFISCTVAITHVHLWFSFYRHVYFSGITSGLSCFSCNLLSHLRWEVSYSNVNWKHFCLVVNRHSALWLFSYLFRFRFRFSLLNL